MSNVPPSPAHDSTVVSVSPTTVAGLSEAADEADLHDYLAELENEADGIKNELRAHLPKSLFMPVDRRDLLEVLDLQDEIADTAQDIAGLLVERKMEVAEGMEQPLLNLVRRCVAPSRRSL